jgi:hypothetical protein
MLLGLDAVIQLLSLRKIRNILEACTTASSNFFLSPSSFSFLVVTFSFYHYKLQN